MYLGYQNGKIKFYTENPLNRDFYALDKVEETSDQYVLVNDEYVLKDEAYEAEQLSSAKQAKISEINTAKELAFKEGIIFNGNHFDCDDRAQDRTGNRLLLLQAMPVETLEWLDYDYKPVVLTAVEFQELCAAIFERVQFIEFKTGQLLEAAAAAVSLEELEAIKISFEEEKANENQPAQGDTGVSAESDGHAATESPSVLVEGNGEFPETSDFKTEAPAPTDV